MDSWRIFPQPIREISLSGMYLLTEQRWHVGTVIAMRLQHAEGATGGPDDSIAIHAKAVRSGADGVGMEFLPWENKRSQDGHDRRARGVEMQPLRKFVSLVRMKGCSMGWNTTMSNPWILRGV